MGQLSAGPKLNQSVGPVMNVSCVPRQGSMVLQQSCAIGFPSALQFR